MSEQKEQGLDIPLIADLKIACAEVGEGTLEGENIQCAIDLLEAQAAEIAELRTEVDGLRIIQAYSSQLLKQRDAAETALATAREDALEEAAKVADNAADIVRIGVMHARAVCGADIAQFIRALKTKEPSHG